MWKKTQRLPKICIEWKRFYFHAFHRSRTVYFVWNVINYLLTIFQTKSWSIIFFLDSNQFRKKSCIVEMFTVHCTMYNCTYTIIIQGIRMKMIFFILKNSDLKNTRETKTRVEDSFFNLFFFFSRVEFWWFRLTSLFAKYIHQNHIFCCFQKIVCKSTAYKSLELLTALLSFFFDFSRDEKKTSSWILA